MTLPRVGGVLLSATPANSYLGHGFYQFRPDLPMAVLVEANGYQLGGAFVVEMRRRARFFRVKPPGRERGRARAATPWPALMFFWGRRVGEVPERLRAQQPDYEQAWESGHHAGESPQRGGAGLRRALAGLAPERRDDLLRLAKLGMVALRGNAFLDRRAFEPCDDI